MEEKKFLVVDSESGLSPEFIKSKASGYDIDLAVGTFPETPEGDLSSKNEISKMVFSGKYSNYAILTKRRAFLKRAFPNNTIVLDKPTEEKLDKHLDWIFSNWGRDRKTGGTRRFVISDTHFFHSTIIKYCNRPWNSGKDQNGETIVTPEDVERMNDEMVRRWNSVVEPGDIVWHLGDFAFGKKENVPEILSRLNGKVNLVMGNHDHHKIGFYYESGFHRVYDRPVIIDNFIILSHAPIQWVKDGGIYGNLYGHVHNQEMYRNVTKNSYNCCVEVNDYAPIPFDTVMERMRSCGN